MPATTTVVVQRSSTQANASVPAARASHSTVLASTSRMQSRASLRRIGYMPASWKKVRQQMPHSSTNQNSAITLGSSEFTGKIRGNEADDRAERRSPAQPEL